MFGYVEPDKPELKMREFDIFKGYYCSVCKTIGRSYGQLPRVVLNYDLTFLALLLDALSTVPVTGKRERCLAHPTSKRLIVNSNTFIQYASDMNILLAYYNLKDKWNDDKSLPGGAAMVMLKRAFKKAEKKHPEISRQIGEKLAVLNSLEKAGCTSVDEAAEPFGDLMKVIFECVLIEDEAARKTLGWLGYNMGRWIYILDAYDDLEKDYKSGSYNPILKEFYDKGNGTPEEFKLTIRERINFNLTFSLSECEKAYSLLGIEKNRGILDNIMYSGLIVKTDKVLQGGTNNNEEKSI